MRLAWMCGASIALGVLQLGSSAGAQTAVSRDDRWREDVTYFAREIAVRHANAFAYVTRDTFDGAVSELLADIPRLSDSQVQLRVLRLTALIRDGHTAVQLPYYGQRLPIATFWDNDGPHIVAASPAFASLIGRRILGIDGHPIAEIADTLRLYLPHENEMSFRTRDWNLLWFPAALRDVGLASDSTQAQLELQDPAGVRSRVTLPAVPVAGFAIARRSAEPLSDHRTDAAYWFAFLRDSRTLYLAYNACQNPDIFKILVDSLVRVIDVRHPARVVIDLRSNVGGSTRVIQPLVAAIRARPTVNRPTALYVLIGRRTFSAGMMAAIQFRRETHATLVGEPIGERPNTYGEVQTFELPNSKLIVTYSTKYFQEVDGNPDAVYPDVSIPPTAQSMIAGRDLAMEWIVARKP